VIDSYARACALMGPTGSGQLAKMVNQICIAGLVQGLAEGINFATKAGLDGKTLIDVISKGAAQSWQMENRASTMFEGKFNFRLQPGQTARALTCVAANTHARRLVLDCWNG
jgi:3-hydroxyisobutyrate dehydrogenase